MKKLESSIKPEHPDVRCGQLNPLADHPCWDSTRDAVTGGNDTVNMVASAQISAAPGSSSRAALAKEDTPVMEGGSRTVPVSVVFAKSGLESKCRFLVKEEKGGRVGDGHGSAPA